MSPFVRRAHDDRDPSKTFRAGSDFTGSDHGSASYGRALPDRPGCAWLRRRTGKYPNAFSRPRTGGYSIRTDNQVQDVYGLAGCGVTPLQVQALIFHAPPSRWITPVIEPSSAVGRPLSLYR